MLCAATPNAPHAETQGTRSVSNCVGDAFNVPVLSLIRTLQNHVPRDLRHASKSPLRSPRLCVRRRFFLFSARAQMKARDALARDKGLWECALRRHLLRKLVEMLVGSQIHRVADESRRGERTAGDFVLADHFILLPRLHPSGCAGFVEEQYAVIHQQW